MHTSLWTCPFALSVCRCGQTKFNHFYRPVVVHLPTSSWFSLNARPNSRHLEDVQSPDAVEELEKGLYQKDFESGAFTVHSSIFSFDIWVCEGHCVQLFNWSVHLYQGTSFECILTKTVANSAVVCAKCMLSVY